MSPSPAPQTLQDDSDVPPHTKSPTPEPLPESDIIQMRRKVVEMRSTDEAGTRLTPREKELAEMVLRLTAVVRPDSDQLVQQADMISALIQQRDLLLYQAEEKRLQWSSEKDGWARMAEALLAQQARNRSNSERDEVRCCFMACIGCWPVHRFILDDTVVFGTLTVFTPLRQTNKGLRQLLDESQSRSHMLESELTRLRPLLLMQPLMSRSSIPPPTPQPKSHARRRKKDTVTTEDEDHGPSEDEPPADPFNTPSQPSQSQATPRAKTRKSEAPNSVHRFAISHRRRPSQKVVSRGLSADARTEHLLLAARKIGKHRAGIMSGMVQHLEEKERERRREESAMTAVASTPKTPKHNMSHSAYASEGGYVYLNGPMQPRSGMQPVPLFIPAYPHHILQTPSSSTTAPSAASSTQKINQGTGTNNPPTPLDSLLNAARSMMREDIDAEGDEDEEVDVVGDSPGAAAGTRHTRSRDLLGSPVPKRRKVTARTDKLATSHDSTSRATNDPSTSSMNTVGVANAGAGRVRSALDVLADQAAAFSTQEPSTVPSETQPQTRVKGKERAPTQPQEILNSTPKSRGRTKSRQEPESDARSSVTPTSRSKTPQSDLGGNPTESARSAQPEAGGGSSLEALVDPGGGTSGASSNPFNPSSSQTLGLTLSFDNNEITGNNDARDPQSQDTSSLHVDESGDATPRQGSRTQTMHSEQGSSMREAEDECHEASPPPQNSEVIPSGDQNGEIPGSGPISSVAPKNKDIIRVAEQDMPSPGQPTKRQRSPYVKWSREEDELLAQAVAKHGQKWDLVQKALPSRGYHQVRQRWLRKLGVFDSKPDLSSYQTAASTFPSTSRGEGVEPKGNPKLGLAPLSSERMISGIVGRPPSMPS
ncbi:hypothetical protein JVU11DRAFT_2162 [Chiua virens]|nr:hypothetical protein JVU11DRAFT_2162 [Chiua virens]